MKKIILLLLVPASTIAQQLNYVHTINYKTPTTTSITNPTIADALQVMVYQDGFGRPVQEIHHQQSNLGNDVITPIEYDGLGRQSKKNLSYTNTAPSLSYNSNAVADQSNYPQYAGQFPFSETTYEKSSLGRILKQSSPGADWANNSGHELRFEYKNNGNGEVKLFIATATWDDPQGLYDIALTQTTHYPENTLSKKIIKNENWQPGAFYPTDNTIEEFRDKSNRLILKRLYDGSDVLDTYYVYDQFGNLTYIIPPKADMTITPTIMDNLCYQYKYDDRNRLVEKKLPGKNQWEFILYDKLNRIIATGPTAPPFTNLTAPGWKVYKYDNYNRVIITAWMSAGNTNFTSTYRKNLQSQRNNDTVISESRTSSTPDITISGIKFRYTSNAYPTTAYHPLTVTYYDDYDFFNGPTTIPTTIASTGETVFYGNGIKPLGLITGKWIRANKTSGATTRDELVYNYYNKNGKVISTYKRNHEVGGTGFTQTDTKLNFIGQVDYTVKTHKRIGSDPLVTVRDFYTYSDQGILVKHEHKINNLPTELLSLKSYDELGKLISEKVGGSVSNPLQNIQYSYNIKGWLQSINNINNLVQSGDPTDLFAYKINHNTVQTDAVSPTIEKQYNGNISETYWRTASDNTLRKYAYKYDKLERLSHAFYRLPNTLYPSVKSYDESVKYDKNGNITNLTRNGDMDNVTPLITIDDLTYTYLADSNRLLQIDDDPVTATSGFKDGNTGTDYTYDGYGNVASDLNKGVSYITYNHLNLPLIVSFGNGNTIEYLYDGEGTKLEKATTESGITTTVKYLDGFQYKKVGSGSETLQFFPTAGGYVSKSGSTYTYVFQYKDHVGNVRISYLRNAAGNLEILEENNFYPLGLKHSGYNTSSSGNTEAQKYKYNDKEYQTELDLNIYDFGRRNYDPAIGRWMNIDPLAEKFHLSSPYSFALNNPVCYIDTNGLEPTPYEAALMAQHVYTNSGQLEGGWHRSSLNDYNVYSFSSGMKAALYERCVGGGVVEYAYVYAGTDPTDLKDWLNNILQVVALSEQYDVAGTISSSLSKKLGDRELTFVGHSLGGGLSNLSALVTGRSSITFNPAWLSAITKTLTRKGAPVEGRHITNYVNEFDPLHALQQEFGSMAWLEPTGDTEILEAGDFWEGDFMDGYFNGHFIGETIDSLEDGFMDYVLPEKCDCEDEWIEVSRSSRYY